MNSVRKDEVLILGSNGSIQTLPCLMADLDMDFYDIVFHDGQLWCPAEDATGTGASTRLVRL